MTKPVPAPAEMPPADDLGDDDQLIATLGLERRGIHLAKLEGRVFLRISGTITHEGQQIPYNLVPAQGVLAKASKWRKMDQGARAQLLAERASEQAVAELQEHAAWFVVEMAEACDDYGLDALTFLRPLADMAVAEPAGLVFDRIRQRLDHAVERQR